MIDTPGILDRPFDEMNTIELQAVTALAHIRAAVIFVLDVSELCHIALDEQLKIYESIKPLFANKVRIYFRSRGKYWDEMVNLSQVNFGEIWTFFMGSIIVL